MVDRYFQGLKSLVDYKICQLLINLDFEKILEDEKKKKKIKKMATVRSLGVF